MANAPATLPPIFEDPRFWQGVAAMAATGALLWFLLHKDNGVPKPPERIIKQAEASIPNTFIELNLPPYITDCCIKLFENQHYAQSVFEACKALEIRVRKKLNFSKFVKNLPDKVWGKDGEISHALLILPGCNPEQQKLAYQTHRWINDYVRNPNAHENIKKNQHEALAHLKQICSLANFIESANSPNQIT